ncbi:MAG: hypothetical protein ACI38Y_06900 [Candidatus Methanomethylophilaceae archaeon]
MTDECKAPLDPTAFGLFFVALVSLPIAIAGILGFMEISNDIGLYLGKLAIICSFFIACAALGAYKAGSNFGFIVFGLVAAGVYFSGAAGGDLYINVTLGIIYLVALIWSYHLGNPKTLTIILLTTALIFLFGGLGNLGGDYWGLLQGIAALANFVLTLYLAFALADEHLPCY